MIPHNDSVESILKELDTNNTRGLSAAEASERLAKYGENKLKEKKKKSMIQKFFEQFKDAMIIILLVAALVSFVIACIERKSCRHII